MSERYIYIYIYIYYIYILKIKKKTSWESGWELKTQLN